MLYRAVYSGKALLNLYSHTDTASQTNCTLHVYSKGALYTRITAGSCVVVCVFVSCDIASCDGVER